MVEQFIDWLLHGLLDLGYPGIVVLMAIESSILPLPSELVMPPAGYWVAKGEMNAVVAVGCGVLGSILGALANYGLAHWLGRGFVRRFGRYVFVSAKALDMASPAMAQPGQEYRSSPAPRIALLTGKASRARASSRLRSRMARNAVEWASTGV